MKEKIKNMDELRKRKKEKKRQVKNGGDETDMPSLKTKLPKKEKKGQPKEAINGNESGEAQEKMENIIARLEALILKIEAAQSYKDPELEDIWMSLREDVDEYRNSLADPSLEPDSADLDDYLYNYLKNNEEAIDARIAELTGSAAEGSEEAPEAEVEVKAEETVSNEPEAGQAATEIAETETPESPAAKAAASVEIQDTQIKEVAGSDKIYSTCEEDPMYKEIIKEVESSVKFSLIANDIYEAKNLEGQRKYRKELFDSKMNKLLIEFAEKYPKKAILYAKKNQYLADAVYFLPKTIVNDVNKEITEESIAAEKKTETLKQTEKQEDADEVIGIEKDNETAEAEVHSENVKEKEVPVPAAEIAPEIADTEKTYDRYEDDPAAEEIRRQAEKTVGDIIARDKGYLSAGPREKYNIRQGLLADEIERLKKGWGGASGSAEVQAKEGADAEKIYGRYEDDPAAEEIRRQANRKTEEFLAADDKYKAMNPKERNKRRNVLFNKEIMRLQREFAEAHPAQAQVYARKNKYLATIIENMRQEIIKEKGGKTLADYEGLRTEARARLFSISDITQRAEYEKKFNAVTPKSIYLEGMKTANAELAALIQEFETAGIRPKPEMKEEAYASEYKYILKTHRGEGRRLVLEKLLQKMNEAGSEDNILKSNIYDELDKLKEPRGEKTEPKAPERGEKTGAEKDIVPGEPILSAEEMNAFKDLWKESEAAPGGEKEEEKKPDTEEAHLEKLHREMAAWRYFRPSGDIIRDFNRILELRGMVGRNHEPADIEADPQEILNKLGFIKSGIERFRENIKDRVKDDKAKLTETAILELIDIPQESHLVLEKLIKYYQKKIEKGDDVKTSIDELAHADALEEMKTPAKSSWEYVDGPESDEAKLKRTEEELETVLSAYGDLVGENAALKRKEGAIEPEKDQVVDEAKLKKMAETEAAVVEKMSPREKKTFLEGLANLGYGSTEWKSWGLGMICKGLGKLTGKNKFLNKYFNKYAGVYEKTGKRAREMRETVGKKGLAKISGTGQGLGNLFKYGRVVYDWMDRSSLRSLNPFRHVTAAAMFIGRSSEVLKETRLDYDNVKENTRVNDLDRAWDEAHAIQEKALKAKKGGKITAKDLEKAYRDNLPEDVQKRFERMGIGATEWYALTINKSKNMKVYADRLTKKIEKIEKNKKLSPDKKEAQKQILLKRNAELLDDLDRMVGDMGTVDSVAFWSRNIEKTGKAVANILIIDSIARMAQAGWNAHHLLDKFVSKEYWDQQLLGEEATKPASSLVPPENPAGVPAAPDETEAVPGGEEIISGDQTEGGEEGGISRETLDELEKKAAGEIKKEDVPGWRAQAELATVRKGEGVTHALKRQLVGGDLRDNNFTPDEEYLRRLGYKGDSHNRSAISRWADKRAAEVARSSGYIGAEGEVRVNEKGVNRAAYFLEKDAEDNLLVHEYLKNESGEFISQETNPGHTPFEGGNKDSYEYISQKKIAEAAVEIEKVSQEIKAEIKVDKELTAFNEFAKNYGLSLEDAQKTGIDIYDKNGFSEADRNLLEFWMEHKNYYPEEIRLINELSRSSGVDYHHDFFLEAYDKMPNGIKSRHDLALGYIKVFAGGKSRIGEGLKELLGMKEEPKWEISVDNTIRVRNAYGKKGFDLLMTEDRIGVNGPLKWNWGLKGGLFTKVRPAMEIGPESIASAREKILSEFENYRMINEGVEEPGLNFQNSDSEGSAVTREVPAENTRTREVPAGSTEREVPSSDRVAQEVPSETGKTREVPDSGGRTREVPGDKTETREVPR